MCSLLRTWNALLRENWTPHEGRDVGHLSLIVDKLVQLPTGVPPPDKEPISIDHFSAPRWVTDQISYKAKQSFDIPNSISPIWSYLPRRIVPLITTTTLTDREQSPIGSGTSKTSSGGLVRRQVHGWGRVLLGDQLEVVPRCWVGWLNGETYSR